MGYGLVSWPFLYNALPHYTIALSRISPPIFSRLAWQLLSASRRGLCD
jgi:hypothetical protein